MPADYSSVTETPDDEITAEAARMLVTRYEQAARLCAAKDVLEVACGSGQGLGYLARGARRVVGGDLTERSLRLARSHYNGRIPLVRLDAQWLPFNGSTFDVVVLHEAIYYLAAPEAFIAESRRVLRDGGALVTSLVNREWRDFNPSPYSYSYPTARELFTLLGRSFHSVEVYGTFPAVTTSSAEELVSLLKRVAVRFHLIPKTMRGKRLLKRLFLGKLVRVPPEIQPDFALCVPTVTLDRDRPHPEFKILYAVAWA